MSEITNPDCRPVSVRFVVLAHDVPGEGLHFDLMIEQGDSLATWKCPVDPDQTTAATPLALLRIANHRTHYLTYEGPISGDRGLVVRHDEGACVVLHNDDFEWLVEFSGRRLMGRFSLRRVNTTDQSWLLSPVPK